MADSDANYAALYEIGVTELRLKIEIHPYFGHADLSARMVNADR
jgi:hypothetical protein